MISSLTTSLLDLLEVDKLRADESSKQLNMVKMSCYILSLFVEKFESEAQAASTRNNTSKVCFAVFKMFVNLDCQRSISGEMNGGTK